MNLKTFAMISTLAAGLLGALALQAQQNAGGAEHQGMMLDQQSGMMGAGPNRMPMMQRMQVLEAKLEQMVQARDPDERQRLLDEYRQQMRDMLGTPGGMSDGGMMMGGGQGMMEMMNMMGQMNQMMANCIKMMQSMMSAPQNEAKPANPAPEEQS